MPNPGKNGNRLSNPLGHLWCFRILAGMVEYRR